MADIARLATEHLIDKGRKRIAFFGDINLPEVAQRYRGYCNALAKHALPVDPQLRVSVPFLLAGQALVDSLLALIDGQSPPSRQLPTELIARATSGV